jgi:hypothetical protein
MISTMPLLLVMEMVTVPVEAKFADCVDLRDEPGRDLGGRGARVREVREALDVRRRRSA